MRRFKQFLEGMQIYDKGGFFGAAGAGVLAISEDTKRCLIGYRSKDVNEPHTWGVVGGAMEGNENPRKAAEREFREETRYRGPLTLIEAYVFKKGDFRYYNFIGIVPNEFKAISDWETEKFEWAEYGKFPKPLHFGLKKLIQNSKALIEAILDRM